MPIEIQALLPVRTTHLVTFLRFRWHRFEHGIIAYVSTWNLPQRGEDVT